MENVVAFQQIEMVVLCNISLCNGFYIEFAARFRGRKKHFGIGFGLKCNNIYNIQQRKFGKWGNSFNIMVIIIDGGNYLLGQ